MSFKRCSFFTCLTLTACLSFADLTLASPSVPLETEFVPTTAIERSYDYLDHYDQRINGEVRVELSADDEGRGRLGLSLRSVGSHIQSQPGFEGLAGRNLHAAFQLSKMVHDGFQVVTFDELGRYVGAVSNIDTRWGYLLRRQLLADGTIAYHKTISTPSLLEVIALGGDLDPGVYRTEIWAHGEPRLRIRYQLAPKSSSILGIEPVGHSWPGASLRLPPARLLTAAQVPPDLILAPSQALPPPTSAAEWNARDAEGKWALYTKTRDETPTSQAAWLDFLFNQRDYDFIGMIALYQLNAFETLLGNRLKEANAPNWIPLTVWCQLSNRGHMKFTTQGLLLTPKTNDLVYSWFQKYPEMQQEPGMPAIWTSLVKARPGTVDVSEVHPPIDPEAVFKDLKVPTKVASFGDRKRSEPGMFYAQQAERAIMGLIVSQRYTPRRLAELMDLTRHENSVVRVSAILGHTHLKPDQFDAGKFLEVALNPAESEPIRGAALMAFSYGFDHEVYAVLHRIGLDPDHVTWKTAISRLGDIGDGFTLQYLKDLKGLTQEQRTFFEVETGRIRPRAEAMNEKRLSRDLGKMLQRYAWADLEADPIAQPLRRWIDESVGKFESSKQVNDTLIKLSREENIQKIPEPLRTRVTEYARNLSR